MIGVIGFRHRRENPPEAINEVMIRALIADYAQQVAAQLAQPTILIFFEGAIRLSVV